MAILKRTVESQRTLGGTKVIRTISATLYPLGFGIGSNTTDALMGNGLPSILTFSLMGVETWLTLPLGEGWVEGKT